jgi:hypothetical protein
MALPIAGQSQRLAYGLRLGRTARRTWITIRRAFPAMKPLARSEADRARDVVVVPDLTTRHMPAVARGQTYARPINKTGVISSPISGPVPDL